MLTMWKSKPRSRRPCGQKKTGGLSAGNGWELNGKGCQLILFVQKKCEGKNSAGVNEIWRGGSRMPLSVSMDGAIGIDGFTPAAENSSEFSAMGPGKSMVMQ
jgi:hypothetical protein